MNTILLSELKAIMVLLETMPRFPMPAPVAPVRIDVPESEIWNVFPYKDEEFAAWLEYEWEETEKQTGTECGPGTPLYEYYMSNRLYPKLLEAGYHYLNNLRTESDLPLRKLDLGLWILSVNIIGNIPQPEDINLDTLTGEYGSAVGATMANRIYGFVDAMFNYDLLNARHIAFDYGERLRLYAPTSQGWVITQLGQTVQSLPDAEAAAFLLILETIRAMLDQDDWFVSQRRLRWLLEEHPVHFNVYARDEEGQFVEELKKDDRWLRRLRWLGIVTYTHDCRPYEAYATAFNSRTIEFTPAGQVTAQAVLASWDDQPGKPSIHSLVSSIQHLESASSQTAIFEELRHIREALDSVHVLVSALQTDFKETQQSFEQQLSELVDEAQRDEAYQQAYEDLHQVVVRSLAQADDRIREYERQLVKRLGKVWRQLAPESQRFLSTAEYLYSEHKGADTLDFAPAAVEYCKVVEKELGERFSRPLLQYLHEKIGPTVKLEFGKQRRKVPTGATARPPELGRLAYLLESSRTSQTNQVVRDFLSSRCSKEIQDFVLLELPAKLKRITTEYRNGSAHTEALSQEKVQEFRSLLLGSKDGSEPSLLQQITRIQPTV